MFIDHIIKLIKKEGFDIKGTAKDCVFRIYRDVRFSKDKSPYKLHMAAFLSPGGKKDFEHPGFYIEFTADKARIYSGLYEINKTLLEKIRRKIAGNTETFRKIHQSSSFKKTFGEILGEKSKRLDAGYSKAAEKEPYLYNKAFYFRSEADSDIILGNELDKWIVLAVRAAKDMNEFLYFK